MFNWASFGFGCAATDFKLGADLIGIGQTQLKFAAQNVQAYGGIMQSMANASTYKSQAASFRIAADDAVKAAGRAQEQGRQAREQRLVKLGQQKGQIIAGASGSGIEVSSSIVDKVMKDTIKSAYNDTAVIAQNEKQAADQKANEASAYRINAIRAEANAEIEGINQDLMFEQIRLNNRAARHAMIGGFMSAAANWMSGMAGAVSGGASGIGGGAGG